MYEVVSDAPIANTDKRVEDKVKLTYVDQDTDKEIHNANIVSLKLWNAGKKMQKCRMRKR